MYPAALQREAHQKCILTCTRLGGAGKREPIALIPVAAGQQLGIMLSRRPKLCDVTLEGYLEISNAGMPRSVQVQCLRKRTKCRPWLFKRMRCRSSGAGQPGATKPPAMAHPSQASVSSGKGGR